MFQKGDLVRVIKAPDQNNYIIKPLIGKLGIIVGKVSSSPSANNIWKVFIEGKVHHLHKLDLEKVNVPER